MANVSSKYEVAKEAKTTNILSLCINLYSGGGQEISTCRVWAVSDDLPKTEESVKFYIKSYKWNGKK